VKDTIISHYRLIEKLGSGVFGEVWRGVHTKSPNLKVAVKVLAPELTTNKAFVQELEQSSLARNTFEHPNIVDYRECLFSETRIALVMTLLEGENCQDLWQRGKVSPKMVLEIAQDALAGLAYAHSKGILHGTLKPSKLFLCTNGTTLLLDFGFLNAIEGANRPTNPSKDGSQFRAPEVLGGIHNDARSDLYSLGLSLWTLLTGHSACPVGSRTIQEDWHQTKGLVSADSTALSPQILAILLKMCAIDPDSRYSSANDALDAWKTVGRLSEPRIPENTQPQNPNPDEMDTVEETEQNSPSDHSQPGLEEAKADAPKPVSTSLSKSVGIAALIWSVSIFLSRIIGLIREAVIGRTLGGGREADVYFSAFIIPDYLNYLLAGGALSLVFIPIFSKYLSDDNEDGGWESFSLIANSLLLILTVAIPILWMLTPNLVHLIAPGFSTASQVDVVLLTRIIIPAQIFHIIGGLLSAVLQAKDRHTIPALAPLLYTGSIVLGGLIGGNAEGFAWGALVGSVLGPFLLPLIGNIRHGMKWSIGLSVKHPDIKTYFLRSLPIMLGFSIIVLDDWFLRREGSMLGEGAVATLSYAKSLMKVPMGVFGLAIGAGVYPTLSRLLQSKDPKPGFDLLSAAVKRVIVLALITQAILSSAGSDIASVIYGDRLWSHEHIINYTFPYVKLNSQADEVGLALGIMSLGLWAWASNTVIARGFYALGNTWMPTLLGSIVTLCAFPLYGFLAFDLGIGLVGLALTSTLAISSYTILLILALKWKYKMGLDNFLVFWFKISFATWMGAAGGFLLRQEVLHPAISQVNLGESIAYPLVLGGITGTIAAVLTIGLGVVMGVSEIREVSAKISTKVLQKLRR
jgi:putative peptidoglycan lipid II flippase